MKHPIVDSLEPVTLVGGGAVGADDLTLALELAPVCVAADGGAARALEAGVNLAAVIGDMDSIASGTQAQIPSEKLHLIGEQMSTDFDKALRHIAAPLVIAVGFTGGRIDHQLAALHTIIARADTACLLIGAEEILFVCPPQIKLPTVAGDIVSLFPMTPVTGKSDGLKWPLEGLDFDPATFIGTSNRANGPVRLELDAPGMICIVRRGLIRPVAQRLAALPATARWPARAPQHKGPRP